tara:strand:+ start:5631 stop:6011 length:381 start_codon:yes stop_codon:yes gene_type:complete
MKYIYLEKIKFLIWGSLNVVINLIIFKLLFWDNQLNITKMFFYYFFVFSIKFLGFNFFVFLKSQKNMFYAQYLKFMIMAVTMLFLNYFYLRISNNFFDYDYFFLQVSWVILCTPLIFVIYKKIIFK